MNFNGQYLTFNEYEDIGGTLNDENAFNLLEYEARKKIDERTFGRLKEASSIPEDVKICDFMLIRVLESYNNTNVKNKGVSSETVGSYSVSYNNSTKEFEETKNIELNNIISSYLSDVIIDGIPLLYRGVK